MQQTTTSTPEQYVAGLTDFGPGRAELFGNSADAYLKVHDLGPHHADVTCDVRVDHGTAEDARSVARGRRRRSQRQIYERRLTEGA